MTMTPKAAATRYVNLFEADTARDRYLEAYGIDDTADPSSYASDFADQYESAATPEDVAAFRAISEALLAE